MQIKENTRFNFAVDICSTLSIILFIVLVILMVHYRPNDSSLDSNGNIAFPIILMFINFIPLIFSLFWLMYRYNYIFTNIGKKYKFTQTRLFQTLLVVGLPIILTILLCSRY